MKNKILKIILLKQFFIFIAVSSFLLPTPYLTAQDLSPTVISAGGESFSAEGYTIDFVLGELTTDICTQQGIMLTQGFLQELTGITSIREPFIKTAKIKLYPNPANNILYIQSETGTQPSYYEIFNMQGNSIGKKQVEHNTMSVDVSAFKPGMYLLKFDVEDNAPITISFIKK